MRAKTTPKRRQDAPRRAKTCQDAPRCAQEGPKTAQDASKTPQEAPKTPQDSENRAKMEPSWHQNRSKWKVILENLKIPQIVLSLQRGLDFQGFGVRYSDIKSMVFKGFSAENPQDAPRRAQDARRCSQDSRRCPQDGPKTPPRRAQDAPRRLRSTPRRPQEEAQDEPGAEKIGIEKRSPTEPPPNLDFRASWSGFGQVFGWF